MQSGPHEEAAVSGDSITRILREENTETFAAVKDAIMQRVLVATVQEAIEALGSPDAIAERALRYVAEDHTALHHASTHLKERLLEAVARRATDELADAKTAALQAQERIETGHEAVIGAKNRLKERLIEAIARRALDELDDPEGVARHARAYINDHARPLARGQETLTKLLIAEIADRSTNELANPKAVARKARARIDDAHMVVTGAVDELKRRLIDEIARRTTDTMTDPAVTARQAQALIDPEHTVILAAVDRLKAHLLETIVQESLEKISGEMGRAPADRAPTSSERAVRSYVKNSVIKARGAASSSASTPPEAPSSTPQMRRRKAANGYTPAPEALPARQRREDAGKAGHYVYGIVARHGLALADALADAAIAPPYTPYLMPHKSVTAIVGNLPGQALDPADTTWHAEVNRLQEGLLEHVNKAGFAVLPMYTPTVHTNQDYLEKALDKYAHTLHGALETLAGKQEWNIKIYCDSSRVQQEVYARDEAIETFLEQFAATAGAWSEAGADAELKAVREGLEAPLPQVVDAILSNCQHHIHRTLDAVSVGSRVAPASKASIFGTSRMVLNASYLVVEAEGEGFRAALEQVATEYEKLGLVYYVGGPHLPCRFATPQAPML